MITTPEFARQLCEREHPVYGTTGNIVPCGRHLRIAQNVAFLLDEQGTTIFEVIARARIAAGLPTFPELVPPAGVAG